MGSTPRMPSAVLPRWVDLVFRGYARCLGLVGCPFRGVASAGHSRLVLAWCSQDVEWCPPRKSTIGMEEESVASRGTTFAKQERDRAKKAKAALKRERREARDTAASPEASVPDTSGEGDIAP